MNAQDAPCGISVIIPIYRSAPILPELIARLSTALPTLHRPFELILVNDGSPDNSAQIMAQLAQQHDWIRTINMMRNYGQHNALLCGIRAAAHPICVTMDDDLQHPPEELPKLLEALADNVSVVYGTPAAAEHDLWRNMTSRVTKLVLQSTMGADTATKVSAFRAFRTELRAAFAQFHGPFVNIDVLLTWGTNAFTAVSVAHAPRKHGQSNYTFRKLVTHAVNMMTGFSVLPLQAASMLGFACTGLGLLLLVWVLGRYAIQGGIVPGFPFLASVLIIFSGAQLLCLGIFGEYLARMHFRIMDKPSYVVRADSGAPHTP